MPLGLDRIESRRGESTSPASNDSSRSTTAVVAGIEAAVALLPDGGQIVTIGSGVATRAGFPGMAYDAGTKSATEGFSRGAARDLAPRGITVNVIEPGFIDTEGNPADGPAAAMFLPTTAMGRYGRPEEIAAGREGTVRRAQG
jgi:NAD(P)-dependent dehydrogenase (short-subunit alcohol dehydrogenase family)